MACRPGARDRAGRDPGAAVAARLDGARRSAGAPPATPATGTGAPLPAFQPVVNTEGSKSSEIRKNLKGFATKDPFKVQGLPKVGAASGQLTAASGHDDRRRARPPAPRPAPARRPARARPGPARARPAPVRAPAQSGPTLTYFTYTVDVRFGKADNLDKKNLEQFRALPSSENPVVVFMGVKTDGRDRGVPGLLGDGHDRRGRLRARRHLHLPLHEGRTSSRASRPSTRTTRSSPTC